MLAGALIALQSSAVQSRVARFAIERLKDKIDGDISIGKILIKPFSAAVIKDMTILDRNPAAYPGDTSYVPKDTLFHAGYITASMSLKGLFRKEGLYFGRIKVSDASMTLVTEPEYDPATARTFVSNLQRVFRMQEKPAKDSLKEPGNIFYADKVEAENVRFRLINIDRRIKMRNSAADRPAGGILWDDLDVTASAKGRRLRMKGKVMSGAVDMLTAKEKSGLVIERASGETSVGHGATIVENLEMHLGDGSHIYMPSFRMSYYRKAPFRDFEHRVVIEGRIAPSVISAAAIAYFAPALKGNPFVGEIEGKVSGPLCDMRIDGLKFKDLNSGVSGDISVLLRGLPKIDKFAIDADVRSFGFTAVGIGKFISGWTKGKEISLGNIAEGAAFTFTGTGKGPLNALAVKGRLHSGIGMLDANVFLRNLTDKTRDMVINGHVTADGLDIGKIIGKDFIGELTAETSLEARLGKGSPEIGVDSIVISRLNLLGYDYSGIRGKGTFADNLLDGSISGKDPNLDFDFNGRLDLSGGAAKEAYRFNADIAYADLNALNIDKRGVSKVSLQSEANFSRTSRGDILGYVSVGDIMLENDAGRHDIGTVFIKSYANENIQNIRFSSSFAEGRFRGGGSLGAMLAGIRGLTAGQEPAGGQDYDMEIRLKDTRELLSFVMPGIYIADSTLLKLSLGGNGIAEGSLSSGRLAYMDKYIRDVTVRAVSVTDSIGVDIASSEIKAGSLRLRDNRLGLFSSGGRFGLSYSFDNGSEEDGRGTINIKGETGASGDSLAAKARILPSTLYFDAGRWEISSSDITYSGDGISIDGFTALCGGQSVSLQGGFSKDRSDTLSLLVNNFDVNVLNKALKQDFGLQGRASGKVLVTSPAEPAHGLLANISLENAEIAGKEAGTLRFASLWDADNERFSVAAREEMDGRLPLNAGGWVKPADKSLDVNVAFDNFDIGFAGPVLASLFSEMHGGLSGRLRASGRFSDIHLSSQDTRLSDAGFVLGFTQVPYGVEGAFHLDDYGVHFDDMALKDRFDGTGIFRGTLQFNGFSDMGIDASAVFRNMECLNTRSADNANFYGNISASGRIGISGPLNAVRLDINASTSGRAGQIHIPLGSSAITRSGNLLSFTKDLGEIRIDPYEELMRTFDRAKKSGSGLSVNLRVNATPDLTALIEVDKSTGNILTGSGSGVIDIAVNPSKDIFSLNGNYVISSGNYHLSVLGIVSRDFTIQDGSSIRFNGDIMDSDLDISGMYRTKSSLTALLADTSSISSRRTVECGIGVRGKLRNPQLDLSINVPDLDPTTLGRVESALNTEDKVQKQFISLLVANSFLPSEESGIVNNTSLINVTEIMASQLNTIFQKLDIPLDLGLSYESNDKGQDIFDLAVSTQLFNNRVVVNGTIGNKNYGPYSSSQVVGDLEIEIKVDRPGTFRVNLFSRSADQYTNYLDVSQRNGAGISFQQEFYGIRQYLRDLFRPRREKNEQESRREASRRSAERVTLRIGEDGKIIRSENQ